MRVTSKEDLTDEASLHNTEAKIMCGARFDIHYFLLLINQLEKLEAAKAA